MSSLALNILLVDDDLFLHRIQSALITKFGHDVYAVASGEAAIQCLHHRDFDLVLMDVMMPEMDGLQTTQKLRQLGCQLPIFALTGNDSPEDRQNAKQAGMNGYLTKPIQKSAFDQLVALFFSA